jgi:hypothetical protein
MKSENKDLETLFQSFESDKYLEVDFVEEIDIEKALADDKDFNIESIFKEIRSAIYN